MRALALIGFLVALGCEPKKAASFDAAVSEELFLEIPKLEAKREFGVDKLAFLARKGQRSMRERAILALGRTGVPSAISVLEELLGDADVRKEVIRALGISGAKGQTARFVALIGGGFPVIEALGRIGDASAVPALVSALSDANLCAHAAIALGRMGKRQIPIGPDARAALIARAGAKDPMTRYGIAYALAKEYPPEQPPERNEALESALRGFLDDEDPELRTVAISGLSARGAPLESTYLSLLEDSDWRVRVEAVRALSADNSTPSMRAWLAAWLVNEWLAIGDLEARLISPRVHAVIEGAARLAARPEAILQPEIRRDLTKLREVTTVTESTVRGRYTPEILRSVDVINCLVTSALARNAREALTCGESSGQGLPIHERKKLAIQLSSRFPALSERLRTDPDPRVRGAALAALIQGGTAGSNIIFDALGDSDPTVIAQVADTLAKRAKLGANLEDTLLDAAMNRADKATDVEQRLSLLELIGSTRRAGAVPILERALVDANVTVREKAKEGLTAWDRMPEKAPPPAEPSLPPVDFLKFSQKGSPGIAKQVELHVASTKGDFIIELDPGVAPYAVATMATLAEKGFYDGTVFHRVVPGFVVQGGDPTGSGYGGPGFVLPGEPSSSQRFVRGAVGIADAGRDTGGSQFFIMHAWAPHLDGRYTLVGRVTSGMDVVDALLVGDAIKRVEVEIK